MKKILSIVALLLSVSTVFGQLSRELDAFEELEVTDRIHVDIIPSTTNKIVIEGELANQMELIQVNNEFRLKMTGSYVMQGDKVFVTLYTSNLSNIIAKKGAEISNQKGKLNVASLNLTAAEGGNIELAVAVTNLRAVINTGGKIELKGTSVNQDVNVMAGGGYFGKSLKSNNAIVRVNAGGKVEVTVSKSIDVQTRAGGIVDVFGKPAERKQKKFAGGKINFN